jgi:folate-binding protein YgfZ
MSCASRENMTKSSSKNFELVDYACFQVEGDDAVSFLQGQLSNDLEALPSGGGQLSTFNDPQGRVIAILRLFRVQEAIIAALPASLLDPVVSRLRMFLLRAQVSISAPAPWQLYGHTGRPPDPGPEGACLMLPCGSDLWLSLQPGQQRLASGPQAEWSALETRCGMPEIYPATSGRFVAQMLFLDRLEAISFSKGCYVGQEVIARAHHLGRVKRHAHLFRSAAPGPRPGDALHMDETKVGEVARVAENTGGTVVLAVIKDGVEGALEQNGQSLEPLPDPPGLVD